MCRRISIYMTNSDKVMRKMQKKAKQLQKKARVRLKRKNRG